MKVLARNAFMLMVSAETDMEHRVLTVRFADDLVGEISFGAIEEKGKVLRWEGLHFPNNYEMLIPTQAGAPIELPWDYVRRLADPEFAKAQRQRHRESKRRTGKRVAKYRKAKPPKGMTKAELAQAVDISAVYLAQIERGEANFTIDILDRLAAALGVDPVDLLGDE